MLCAWILNQKYLWLNDFYLWIFLIWAKNGLTWLNIVLHSFNIPLFLHQVELTKICMKNKIKGRRYSRITYPFCAVYCFSMLYAGSAYCMNYRYPLSQSDAGSSVTSYRKEALRNDTLLKDGTKKREKQDFLQEAQKPCKALGLPDSVDMMGDKCPDCTYRSRVGNPERSKPCFCAERPSLCSRKSMRCPLSRLYTSTGFLS